MAVPLLLAGMAMAFWPTTPTPRPDHAKVAAQTAPLPPGPPWIYGKADAHFTITLYADLECPYCQGYFPQLKRWIDANPDVNLQWQHLPLAMHEPSASRQAWLTECAGEAEGQKGFWHAVEWVYRYTQGDGRGLPACASYPGMGPVLQACLESPRPRLIVQRQIDNAHRQGIGETPTLQLKNRLTGQMMVLSGPIPGDALLSALDQLTSSSIAPQPRTSLHD
ncbi:thioredoxin domain-containing protein [Xanthomonas euvesicatoria]|nr:thioredoxin domain-containing protein [Xanthomonas euvesicatoria]